MVVWAVKESPNLYGDSYIHRNASSTKIPTLIGQGYFNFY
jgi:hypothetical protein